jgi:hypothetical protein
MSVSIGFGRRDFSLPMAETRFAVVDQPVPDDLISFLKAIPDGRYRRGVRSPQWFLLLVAVLGILSGCRSSRDLEAFAAGIGRLSTRRWTWISSAGLPMPPFSTCSIRPTCRSSARYSRPG